MKRRVSAAFFLSIASAGLLVAAASMESALAQTGSAVECRALAEEKSANRLLVPDFRGCTPVIAKRWQAVRDFPEPTIEYRESAVVPQGRIDDHSPGPNAPFQEARAGMVLWVSTGPPDTPPPPPPARNKYQVDDAAPVEEGGQLQFTIRRERAGGPASITYETRPANDDGDAVEGVDFRPVARAVVMAEGVASLSVPVQTLPRSGENGERRVRLALVVAGNIEEDEIVDKEGVGSIRDKPEPPPEADPSFALIGTVTADGHGADFKVTRTGSLPPYLLPVRILRDGLREELASLEFAGGQAVGRLPPLPADCAGLIEASIDGPGSSADAVPVVASVRVEPEPDCPVPGSSPGGKWPWVVLVLVAVGGLIVWRLPKRKRDPIPIPDPVPPPPPPSAPAPPPTAACAVDPGACRQSDVAGQAFGAPPFRLGVEVETGGASVTDDLPIEREEDGDD